MASREQTMPRDLYQTNGEGSPRNLYEKQGAQLSPAEERQVYYDTLMNNVSGLGRSVPKTLARVGGNALDVLGELAAASNKSVTEFIDFLGPGTVNAILRLSGSNKQIPTATGTFQKNVPGAEGGFMEPGTARDVVQAAGANIPAALGMVPVSRMPGVKAAAEEFLGFGSTRSPAKTVSDITSTAEDLAQLGPESPIQPTEMISKKQARKLALQRGTGEPAAAGYKFDQAGNIVEDKLQQDALRQGLEPGLVAMIKASNKKGKKAMLEMLGRVQMGRKNIEMQGAYRAQDVAGKSLKNRIQIVTKANRMAASKLEEVSENLRDKPADFKSAREYLRDRFRQADVIINDDGTLDFAGSTYDDQPGNQTLLRNIWKRLEAIGDDAHKGHKTKRFIDNSVSYGKQTSERGINNEVENIAKNVRREIDNELDSKFADYNNVNTQYSNTRDVIDDMQGFAGKKVDLMGDKSERPMGLLSRRIIQNYKEGQGFEDAILKLDAMAKEYADAGSKIIEAKNVAKTKDILSLDDDLLKQILFANSMDEIFGTPARASIQGLTSDAIMRRATASKRELATEAGTKVLDKLRGINQDAALDALIKLVKE